MKLKLEWHTPALITIVLLYLAAQNTAYAQITQPAASQSTVVAVAPAVPPAAPANVSADAIAAQAAAAARQDVDPQINGSIRDVPSAGSGK